MKPITKKIAIVGAGLLVMLGYWFVTRTSNPSGDRSLVSESPVMMIADENVKQKKLSKAEAYDQEQKEDAAKQKQFLNTMENSKPKDLVVNFKEATKDQYSLKIEETKRNNEIIRSYDGKFYGDASSKSEQVINSNAPDNRLANSSAVSSRNKQGSRANHNNNQGAADQTTYKASVSNLRATELEPIKKEPTSKNELFNTTSYSETTLASTQNDDLFKEGLESENVKAQVFGDQDVKQGGLIRFRLTEEAVIGGIKYPRNTVFFGKGNFSSDRLLVNVDKLPSVGGKTAKVKMVLHDQDLQEGIYAPTNQTKSEAMDQSVNASTQLIASATPVGMIASGVNSLVRTKTNVQAISVRGGYQVNFSIEGGK